MKYPHIMLCGPFNTIPLVLYARAYANANSNQLKVDYNAKYMLYLEDTSESAYTNKCYIAKLTNTELY